MYYLIDNRNYILIYSLITLYKYYIYYYYYFKIYNGKYAILKSKYNYIRFDYVLISVSRYKQSYKIEIDMKDNDYHVYSYSHLNKIYAYNKEEQHITFKVNLNLKNISTNKKCKIKNGLLTVFLKTSENKKVYKGLIRMQKLNMIRNLYDFFSFENFYNYFIENEY